MRKSSLSWFMRTILIFLATICFTLTAVAGNTILVVGDSLSSAYGMRVDQGWVTLLAERIKQNGLPYRVVNVSEAGDTTSHGLAELPALLDRYHPDVTLLELGGNDGLRGMSLMVIKANLAAMIKLVQQAGGQVLLLGLRLPPNYGPDYTKQFQDIYVDLAKAYGVAVVPLLLAHIDDQKQYFQDDRIHPTADAQPLILNNVWPILKALLDGLVS